MSETSRRIKGTAWLLWCDRTPGRVETLIRERSLKATLKRRRFIWLVVLSYDIEGPTEALKEAQSLLKLTIADEAW